MTRPLRARRFRFPTLEVLDDRFPVASLAQEAFDRFAKCSLSAAARHLPLRNIARFGCSVVWGGGDSSALHRCEIRKVVAEIEDLIEAEGELTEQSLARLQLVRRSLLQLLNSQLARAPQE